MATTTEYRVRVLVDGESQTVVAWGSGPRAAGEAAVRTVRALLPGARDVEIVEAVERRTKLAPDRRTFQTSVQ